MSRVPRRDRTVLTDSYRHALSRIPAPVAVVSTTASGAPRGFAIGTLTAASLEPPLVSFYADPDIELARGSTIGVDLLEQRAMALFEHFRHPGGRDFDGLEWMSSANGAAHLPDAVVAIDAIVSNVHRVGDRDLVVARVTVAVIHDPLARPLIFQSGRAMRLDSGVVIDPRISQLGWG